MSMPELSGRTRERLRLLGAAWKVSEADVIDRLLDMFVNQWPVTTGDTAAEQQDQIPVQAVYEAVVTEGLFEVASGRLTITSGDLQGRTYRSPSGAAMAVVRHLNPNVHPNRNGWTFWTTHASGEFIQKFRLQGAGRNPR